ncbi:SusD/RagB family nutrient-binding outer membrane lipoprotein [Algoriphagus sp. H41]|uniref:SusD/RagB family nutrient-binding outer membrane lipoprotein n=1 Tax=Algoriphagus oliviformis TaxID=2811231 RepID=A0ABS3C2A3_9BACT|nr:SusD/RagB family nutrient-binding outer membrane lipoprotein [Algoriphagus oliviformis]MBN7811242.1 SusD/RagB family nutrient-binding outer membrane lipoprotein [Algoriphagus oliviformis]
MKKTYNYLAILFFLVLSSSCDEGFDELNTNKVRATTLDPIIQLNAATLGLAFPTATLIYEVGVVQQVISPNSGVLTGANYNQDNRASTQVNWQNYYQNVVKNTSDVISRTKDIPAQSNVYNMARIVQAHAFMILTDTYGSVPFTEAGRGYSDQIFFPAYDTQESIYPQIIQELDQAGAALSLSGKIETADILYKGSIPQWKAYANSLLLRAGMRLSRVNPTLAQQVVAKAAPAVILANSGNALIAHDANYTNPIGNMLNSTEASNFFLAAPFVNYLKATGDPRLRAIAVTYVGAKSGPEQTPANASSDPAIQVGMPMGNDNAGAVKAAAAAGLASFYEFAQVDRRRITKLQAPNFLVTASQNLLLLAEARNRGWITTGTVEEYYRNAVIAHMNQISSIDPASTIPQAAIDQYLAANPFDPAKALEQINTQYWISSFLNGPEAFANFRRSGFPVLQENPFPGREVPFINRLTYPNSEISVNGENVGAAISAQGPDDLATKVWWHK